MQNTSKSSVQSKLNPRILVVAPGNRTRGGITSVVHMHERSPVWQSMRCKILSTHADGSSWCKIKAACWGYVHAPLAIWRSDLVHVHLAGETSLLRKLPIIMLTKMLRKALIVHVHAHSPESLFDRGPQWAVRYALQAADRVIALSVSWAAIIQDRIPSAAVEVMANPVGPCTFRAEEPMQNIVLCVGKVEPRKGYRDLLLAATLVRQSIPDAQFWFAGHGDIEEGRGYAEQLGISTAVHFLGWLAEEELGEIYSKARVFCLPSYNEGLPMAVLEAMSHGLPVVCTSVGGLPELIEDGVGGLLIEPGDVGALAGSLLRLLMDKDLRKKLGDNAGKIVAGRCGLQDISCRLESLYLRVLAPHPV
jgi:glycosyltransferase involved in cell wall biosynthesis